LFDLDAKQKVFQRDHAFVGVELVPKTRQMALMN
jgi:type I restriction enzyme M protein